MFTLASRAEIATAAGTTFPFGEAKSFPCFYCVGGVAKAWCTACGSKRRDYWKGQAWKHCRQLRQRRLPPLMFGIASTRKCFESSPHHRKHLLTARQLSKKTIDQAGFACSLTARMRRAGAGNWPRRLICPACRGFQKDDRWCLYSIGAGNGYISAPGQHWP